MTVVAALAAEAVFVSVIAFLAFLVQAQRREDGIPDQRIEVAPE